MQYDFTKLPFGRAYAGIGSRSAPDHILQLMIHAGEHLAFEDWTLFSGGADGADHSFEWGCDLAGGKKQIFLPGAYFNGRRADENEMRGPNPDHQAMAEEIAASVWNRYAFREDVAHWDRLKPFTKALMTRNVHQVLGPTLSERARFVLCWTPDGAVHDAHRTKKTGGTGQAISMASLAGVPVYNLYRPKHLKMIRKWLAKSPASLTTTP